jgi:hypothetical protein
VLPKLSPFEWTLQHIVNDLWLYLLVDRKGGGRHIFRMSQTSGLQYRVAICHRMKRDEHRELKIPVTGDFPGSGLE